MTIRDLLAAESINLNGTPAGKTEALNQCIDLMAKVAKLPMLKRIARAFLQERRKAQQELEWV